jgi:hypothetical protein
MPERSRRSNDEIRHEVNDRIAEVAAHMDGGEAATYEFLCECDRLGCREVAHLTLAEYQAIEAASRRLIVPAHYDASQGTVEAVGPSVLAVARRDA